MRSPPDSRRTAGSSYPLRCRRSTSHAFDGQTSLADIAATLLTPYFENDPLVRRARRNLPRSLRLRRAVARAGNARRFRTRAVSRPDRGIQGFRRAFPRRVHAAPAAPRHKTAQPFSSPPPATRARRSRAAFHRVEGFRVVILYPDGRVSPRQAHQLGCFGDNVSRLRVAGSFDDCQRMVKHALGDAALQADVPLTSANSISLGRLLPQMAYYAHAALAPPSRNKYTFELCGADRQPRQRDGVHPGPRNGLADRRNRTRHERQSHPARFLRGRRLCATTERRHARQRDGRRRAEQLRATALAVSGSARTAPRIHRRCRRRRHHRIDDRIALSIASAKSCARIPRPAVHALQRLRSAGASGDWAVVSTAHPAKFERVVEPLIGREIPIPAPLAALLARPCTADPLPARDDALAAALRDASIRLIRTWPRYLAELASRAIMRAPTPDQTASGIVWGGSSAGRALRSQCRGREFDPPPLHHFTSPDVQASPETPHKTGFFYGCPPRTALAHPLRSGNLGVTLGVTLSTGALPPC